MQQKFSETFEMLNEIISDEAVAKNIKKTMTDVVTILEDDEEMAIRCDRAIQLLNITDDPNIDAFTRTRVWSLISMLESIGSNE